MSVLVLGETEFMGERYPAYKVDPRLIVSIEPVDPAEPDGPAAVTISHEERRLGTYTVQTADSVASVRSRMRA